MYAKTLVAAVLTMGMSCADAGIVWKGNFETGNLGQWSGHQFREGRIRTVQIPGLPNGNAYAAEVELRPGDWNNSGNRNELVHVVYEPEGAEYYYRWQTFFPADYPIRNAWQVFTQWHSEENSGVPPVQFFVNGTRMKFSIEGSQRELWDAPLQLGVWHDFILHVKFSNNANVGFAELWHNGQQVVPLTYGQTRARSYLKQGLYRNSSIDATAIIYHTGMVQGTTMQDVAPPPPEPPACAEWDGDFTSGNLDQWTRLQAAAPDRFVLEAAPQPAPSGLPSARVTVQPGDVASSGNRAQLVHLQGAAEGTEYFYRWNSFLPSDYPSVGESQILLSLNRRDDVAAPPVVLRTQGEQMQLVVNDAVAWRGALQRNRWENYVLQVRYSEGNGVVGLYRDGRVAMAPRTATTYTENYLKFGLNRSGALAIPSTVYLAGMRQRCSPAAIGQWSMFDNGFEG